MDNELLFILTPVKSSTVRDLIEHLAKLEEAQTAELKATAEDTALARQRDRRHSSTKQEKKARAPKAKAAPAK